MLIEQLEDDDEGITPVTNFPILDYSNYSNKGVNGKLVKKTTTVEQWKSEKNQEKVSPDIILYVVAPHMQFLRGDRKYLRALLESLKNRHSNNKVIFALNIHSQEGQQIPTPQNIEDARTKIAEIYEKYYPSETLLIAEIDSLKGTGFSQVAKFMCEILPDNKIGKMEEVLRSELKESAKKERSRRYRQALIYIASRLATYKVNTPIGKGIIEEAYAAVCDYGIRIFKEEEIYLTASRELDEMVDNFAAQTKISREEAIKIMVSDVEVLEQYIEEENGINQSKLATIGGASTGAVLATMFLGPLLGPVSTIAGTVAGAKLGEIIERRFVSPEKEREDVIKKVPQVVEKEQEVGTRYLQGGYPVVENLLAIGLGIESVDPSQDLRNCFEDLVKAAQERVRTYISRYQDQINRLAESSDTPEKAKQAEIEIIKILEQTVIN